MKAKHLLCALLAVTWSANAQTPMMDDLGDVSTEDGYFPLYNEPSRQDLLKLTKSPNDLELNAIPMTFTFPADTLVDSINHVDRKNVIFGVDLSHYTASNYPFNQLAAHNVRFVYTKATQGTSYKDPKFAAFWSALDALPAKQKVLRGAYHFLSSADAGAAQADRYVAFVNLHGGFKPDDLPPVMDLEWDKASANGPDRWKNRKPADIVASALAFLTRVEQLTGRTPVIYTARSWWRDVGIAEKDIAKFSRYPIWIADYSKSARAIETPAVPNKAKFSLWQFTDSAKLSGAFRNGMDANIFYGTDQDFLNTFYGSK